MKLFDLPLKPLALACIALFSVSSGLATDLADTPLANSTTTPILPNIAFILDDSGSMDEENMPDGNSTNASKYCYRWHGYNTLSYNPAITYKAPPGYSDAKFTNALKDGYFASGAKMYDGSTTNGYVNLETSKPSIGYYAMHKTDATATNCETDTKYNIITESTNINAPGTTTGSAAALTNFANWYSYYRKRAFLAKAAAAFAFQGLEDDKYRVGLMFINSIESGLGVANNDLKIDAFSGTHRANWYSRLYGTRKDSGTPLRAALSRAGRMYAGKITGWDPVQYSCQRNFTILTTDGYWNESSGYKQIDGSTNVGEQDGVSGVTRPSYDGGATKGEANTLADVAYYYYHTDLRTSALSNCTGTNVGSQTYSVCANNVPPAGTNDKVDDVATHQHMTTFTIGLGVNGTLTYRDDYKTATSGDYFNILQGSNNWPKPSSGSDQKIDDLWHAAVNGRGTYFSAKNADTFAAGIKAALGSIEASKGSGAAAATSNLQPTAGDNFTYVASYRTVYWDGELSAYTIDLSSGEVSKTPSWSASTLLATKIATNGDSDTRTIKTWDGSGANNLKNFEFSALSTTEKGYFNNNQLSQWNNSGYNQAEATQERLIKYLRGQDRYENETRDSSYGSYFRLYRDREKILGDIVHSQPVYVKGSFYDYLDTGYSSFKAALSTRAPTIYVSANDGMLHAIDASSGSTAGSERWAYIPPMVLPELWRIADERFKETDETQSIHHRYYLDGPITVSDILVGSTWKTILVGAMGKGGRGIYALDITDPSTPKALWNFTSTSQPYSTSHSENLGYTYGTPMITKLSNGTWVVVVGSGYNNVSPGNGEGYVFVLDANNGTLLKSIPTSVGDTSNPSGLTYLNLKVTNFQQDNTAEIVYGGDLLGNVWAIDINSAKVRKVIALNNQPITVAPEIGEIDGNTVLFFGTGKYLGKTDLKNKEAQSFYAIKDDGKTTLAFSDRDSKIVKRTATGEGSSKTISGSTVDWISNFGWYVDLIETGNEGATERVNLSAQLYFGTLIFSSTIPTADVCEPGGRSNLYLLDYSTGLGVNGASSVAIPYTSALVGLTVAKLPTGTVKIYGITADGAAIKARDVPISSGGASGSDKGRRVMWRELLN